jgi:DNA-3-methyladenine glycosylase
MNTPKKLNINFYNRNADVVAPELLGKILVHKTGHSTLKARIVETEAYLEKLDPANHAFKGHTNRNAVMFGPAGHLYIYFTYGLHFCANVVAGPEGSGQAVLLRAAEPLEGIEAMALNRLTQNKLLLCNGPAKLTQAFAINKALNGISLLGSTLWIEDDNYKSKYATSRRIGISKAVGLPLRFYISGNKYVSKPNKYR